MVRFKVRPKIGKSPPTHAAATPCHTQLISLLACFATSGDMRGTSQCADAARSLGQCMATSAGGGRAGARGSVWFVVGLAEGEAVVV